ncbi:MAG: hypothetical protein HDR38_01160 [Treponema sp.]|nr:hypothetical protein [Treponema sp.]
MMKKISKLALLAAATAFLLAAFPACSNDDDDNTTVQPGGSEDDGSGGGDNTGGDNTGTGTPITFDATNASTEMGTHLSTLELKGAVTDGTYDGVTISSATRGNDSSKLIIEIAKNGTASFPVKTGAKVTIAVGSTSSTNATAYTITGGGLDNSSASVTGTSYEENELGTASSDGTVTFTPTDRGLRIKTITVTY